MLLLVVLLLVVIFFSEGARQGLVAGDEDGDAGAVSIATTCGGGGAGDGEVVHLCSSIDSESSSLPYAESTSSCGPDAGSLWLPKSLSASSRRFSCSSWTDDRMKLSVHR